MRKMLHLPQTALTLSAGKVSVILVRGPHRVRLGDRPRRGNLAAASSGANRLAERANRGAKPKIRLQQPASPTILVYVSGSVARLGLFRMSASSRVNEAVSRAGGMPPGADAAGVNLAAVLEDGQQINVPK